ncbi:hypothetical protein L3Q82_020858, partial [Scortum barcoo]
MPYHLWKVRLVCPKCGGHLTGGGVHKRARQVLDIDRNYLMVTEALRCSSAECKSSYLSSGNMILDQLDLPHRSEFRIILTRKYACDIHVIRLMREQTLGNSSTRLAKQLKENHSEEWLQRLARYLGECADFVDRPSLFPVVCQDPPEPVAVPTNRWLMTVYAKDIMSRMDHIKARITSVFGSVLKMVSTKKITKKLSGAAKGTALWLTSVSNELGQILISVLTAQEGPGLDDMVADLIRRYSQAGMPPPKLLYVDTGCCVETGGRTKLQQRFDGWPDLNICLDIFHFMRRLAAGCTTDTHPLYPIFMARLSVCIFEWDPEDVTLLRRAKRLHLQQEGVPGITDALVDKSILKEELALHCRRKTRGEESTISLIEHLLQELMGEKGKDLLGVPLLDRVRKEHIWRLQKRHVKCIQDMPGVALYTETGTTTTKEGMVLKNYRCARGSTSLESFHLHLNRFIPGTKANSLNFQLFLLEGLNRWNQDRAAQSLATKPSGLFSYSGDLVQSVNTNSLKVLGRKYVPSFHPPLQYTGEPIGVEYLYRQTGQPIQDMNPDSEETDELLEDLKIEEEQEDEGFEDHLQPPLPPRYLQPPLPPRYLQPPLPPHSLQPASSSTLPAAASSSTLACSRLFLHASLQPPLPPRSLQPPLPPRSLQPPLPPRYLQPPLPPHLLLFLLDLLELLLRCLKNSWLWMSTTCLAWIVWTVWRLEYLVGLRNHTGLTLSKQEVSTIISRWQNLLPYDQQRVVFAARHQDRLIAGKFRSPKKKAEFTPGVESSKRCVLGSTASPAQWPDCCRLIEAIFVRLCRLHKNPKKQRQGTVTRWTVILQDYRNIRQLILDRAAIQDMNPDSEETDELLEDLNIEEEQEDEGFEDQYADTTVGEPYEPSIYSGPALRFLHPACCFLCFHTTCS